MGPKGWSPLSRLRGGGGAPEATERGEGSLETAEWGAGVTRVRDKLPGRNFATVLVNVFR